MLILCDLEIYFPPSILDIMVHLLIHVVEDIVQLGAAFLRSMMPFERMNGDTSQTYLLFQTLLLFF